LLSITRRTTSLGAAAILVRSVTADVSSCNVYEANEKRTKGGERRGENANLKFNVTPYKKRVIPERVRIGKELALQNGFVY
jgi:hypothetical protein